jgi:hypothetical protein
MLARINCFKIIRNHFATLRTLGQVSKRIYWQDFLLFIVTPIIISSALTFCNLGFEELISHLIAAISILGGFLFNLLAIIYNSMENLKNDAEKSRIKTVYIKEIHSNISYNILLAIFCIISMLIYYVVKSNLNCNSWINLTILFFNYVFLISFFLTLLMVLNRIYILLNKNIRDN